MVITRAGSERVCDFAFPPREPPARRAGGRARVTCVDKANVFRSMAFFRKIFDERAARFPDVRADHRTSTRPRSTSCASRGSSTCIVTENMFGDILSDLPRRWSAAWAWRRRATSATDHALFQPCHGSAPDIAGQGMANPIATILSAR